MALKLNKHSVLLLLALFSLNLVQAQLAPSAPPPPPPPEVIETVSTDSLEEEVTTTDTETDETTVNFYQGYNFSEEEQTNYNNQKLSPQFDKAYWDKERKKINFKETYDTVKPKKKEPEKADPKSSKPYKPYDFADLKFVFIGLALVLLLILIIYLLRNSAAKNLKVNSNILVNFDDLDEQTLRDAELLTPLNAAIKAGDYQTAYRIKYLEVLQQLIHKNLIYYKKEKTNYEYLLQLSGKAVYDPFRQLTFNFDGIWYGEMNIDKNRFESLLPYFNQFETTLRQS
jgi:hypothetical protein